MTRTTLALMLLAACTTSTPPPTHAAHTEPQRPSDWWIEKPSDDQPVEAAASDGRRDVLPLERTERVQPDTTISGVDVTAAPAGAGGWQIVIDNKTDAMIGIVWDECTFVSSSGESLGRLIRGETRRMDTGNAQPPTPLAPHARLTQVVFVEQLLGDEETEANLAGHRFSPELTERIETMRRDRSAMIIGGRLVLTIQLSDGKRTWSGRVSGGE